MRVNKKQIQKWVDYLRSGKVPQSQYVLNDGKGMCCMGLAVDLQMQETGKKWRKTGHKLYHDMYDNFEIMGLETQNWYGIKNNTVSIESVKKFLNSSQKKQLKNYQDGESTNVCLSGLNDLLGCSFNQIADMLEEEYLK